VGKRKTVRPETKHGDVVAWTEMPTATKIWNFWCFVITYCIYYIIPYNNAQASINHPVYYVCVPWQRCDKYMHGRPRARVCHADTSFAVRPSPSPNFVCCPGTAPAEPWRARTLMSSYGRASIVHPSRSSRAGASRPSLAICHHLACGLGTQWRVLCALGTGSISRFSSCPVSSLLPDIWGFSFTQVRSDLFQPN
jgi:hypothetical protein